MLNAILSDLMSRIWMTYRRGFPAIGEELPNQGETSYICIMANSHVRQMATCLGKLKKWPAAATGTSGITSDVGWGCTLRSGQMLLAQVRDCSLHAYLIITSSSGICN